MAFILVEKIIFITIFGAHTEREGADAGLITVGKRHGGRAPSNHIVGVITLSSYSGCYLLLRTQAVLIASGIHCD